MTHINELKFEGGTPWIKAMNLASNYYAIWKNSTDKKEAGDAYESWCQIRYEIESGVHGNNDILSHDKE